MPSWEYSSVQNQSDLVLRNSFLTLKGTPPQGGENKASDLVHSKFLNVLYRQQIHVSRFSEVNPRHPSKQTPGLRSRSWSPQLSTPSGLAPFLLGEPQPCGLPRNLTKWRCSWPRCCLSWELLKPGLRSGKRHSLFLLT